ncbi:MAG TPA: ABC transporter permease [Bryobacteraceae bacterium]|jgi:putative ABC transport system permease protein|nr:ABC transporter permease [Bryobacteraceae bacterium]
MPDAFLQDLRYALRALRSSPAFAAVAIFSLALGIGANTAIFSLIDSVILKTLPVRHPEQLVQVTMGKSAYYTNPIWEQVRDRQDVFSSVFAFGGARFNLAAGGEARYAMGRYVAGQFFDTLGLNPLLGRTFAPADDKRGCPGTAVLSYGFWQTEYAGRADIVGKNVSLDNHPFQIIGVIEPGFTGVDVGSSIDVYVPLCAESIINGERSMLDMRSAWWLRVIGRPKPGISASQAEARLKTLAPAIFDATTPPNYKPEDQANYRKRSFDTKPVANGLSDVRNKYQLALTVLMVITGAVLLIACVNVANLLLARSAARQREIAIRMALGSGRGRLIRQLLTESLVLSLTGAALGILFAQWGARLLVGFLSDGANVYLNLTLDFRVLAFTAGVAMLTGLLFGLAPAWKGTRVDPQSAMKANARGVIEGSRFGLGKALVVLQVALSLVLVVGAGLMLTTFFKLETLDSGFERGHILLTSVDLRNGHYPPERRGAVYREILEHLRALPGVRSVSDSGMVPISGSTWNQILQFENYTSKARYDTLVNFNQVSEGFFDTFGTLLIAGRDFNARDIPESPQVAVVNQTLVKKFFAAENPIGKRFRVEEGNKLGEPVEIVGIVKDAKYETLRDEAPPTVYLAMSQNAKPHTSLTFEVRSAGAAPAILIPAVKSAIAEVNRDVSLQFKSLAVQVDESLTRERLLATLSGFFGALALLLAMIGLYGVMSYNVARRRNEIGIRMALGAEQSRVLRMVLREVASLIAVGLVIGLGASIATTRFVESFLYGMKPNDPWTLSLAAGILALVAAVAGFLPARRASRLDPMTALREE